METDFNNYYKRLMPRWFVQGHLDPVRHIQSIFYVYSDPKHPAYRPFLYDDDFFFVFAISRRIYSGYERLLEMEGLDTNFINPFTTSGLP